MNEEDIRDYEQGTTFEALKSLTINTGFMHPDMFAFLQSIMPGVENFAMMRTHINSQQVLADGWPNLKQLKAHECDTRLLFPLLHSHRHLFKLSVSSNKITDAQLVECAPILSDLTLLRLHHCPNVTNLGISALVEACPKLIVLQITANSAMTDAIITTVATCCPHLEHLMLRGSPKFSMLCLFNLLRTCPAMKSVTLGWPYASVHSKNLQKHKQDFLVHGVTLRYDTKAAVNDDALLCPYFGHF